MIGDIIKALRKENNLSQKALAEQIGVSQKQSITGSAASMNPKQVISLNLPTFFMSRPTICWNGMIKKNLY